MAKEQAEIDLEAFLRRSEDLVNLIEARRKLAAEWGQPCAASEIPWPTNPYGAQEYRDRAVEALRRAEIHQAKVRRNLRSRRRTSERERSISDRLDRIVAVLADFINMA